MTKRNFLKTSASLMAGSAIAQNPRKNWAGNYAYKAPVLRMPRTLDEVRNFVKAASRVKAVGARHSFNSVADSPVEQISMRLWDRMSLDVKTRKGTVGAGVTYGQLAPYLEKSGFAVHNLASLPHVSVVGACNTATHGSGSKNGNLATAVSGFELVIHDGSVVNLSREKDGERFNGAVVALGALGVITNITLDVVPTFQVRQTVYENLSLAHFEKNFDEIFNAGYSVSIFTDWQKRYASELWVKSIASSKPSPQELFGAKAATRKLHPLVGLSAENCTDQLGVAGPWYERLPHFRMNFTPSSGDELQAEYFVPRNKAYQAILAMERLRDRIAPHLMISELRTIASDELWLSMAYLRPSLAIHFTWKPHWPEVKALLPEIEREIGALDPRPHWGKLFSMKPKYPKTEAFRALAKQYDPQGKFRNEFLDANVFTSS